MAATRILETVVYASHTQFYLADPEGPMRTDVVWDGAGLERRLGVTDGLVAVGTVGYCDVPVTVEIWEGEPVLDLEAWDHVAEVSLELRSGRVALGGVEGAVEHDPISVAPGWYRLRSSAVGLDDADEMDGGDRYRLQLWPHPAAIPEVRKWWSPWNPADTQPRRTTAGGRIVVGPEAHDLRVQMAWLASRGEAHLFQDDSGTLWEHSTLPDRRATPQLEELDEAEALRRYGTLE